MLGKPVGRFLKPSIAIELAPTSSGVRFVNKSFEDLDYALDWRDGALRYQTGGINALSIAAFNASAELIRAADPAETEKHTLALTDRVLAAAERLGYTVTSCLDRPHRSQIVSFSTGAPGFRFRLCKLTQNVSGRVDESK
jgi:selenocysteine lyase/cysteine desulfurase